MSIGEWAKHASILLHTSVLPIMIMFAMGVSLTFIYVAQYQNKRSRDSVEIGMSYLERLFSLLNPALNSNISKQLE